MSLVTRAAVALRNGEHSVALITREAITFNALVTLLKQSIGKSASVASYLTHTCPRCKYFLGVVVREPSVGGKARSVKGFCLRCRYQLNWKLIRGTLFRHSLRASYLHGSEHPPTRPEQRRTLSLVKPKGFDPPINIL